MAGTVMVTLVVGMTAVKPILMLINVRTPATIALVTSTTVTTIITMTMVTTVTMAAQTEVSLPSCLS